MKQVLRSGIGSTTASFAVVLLIVIGGMGVASTMQSGTKSGSEVISTSSTTTPSYNGLQLIVSSNASVLAVGQSLNVSLSIVNTLPKVNTVKPSNDWLMHGVPVALWPPCYFGLPAEAAVLHGNYSLQDIGSAANVTFSYICMEGVNVDHVIFQPNSDQVNLTGLYDVTQANQTLGPFHMSLSFTTGGYWNLQNLSSELNIPIIGESYPWDNPAYTPFTPGVYTVAVADEWGEVALLHFTVSSSAATTTAFLRVSFAPPWRYVGNTTLTGSLSACEALRLPCPTNTTTPAEEFANGTAIIYAEELTVCQQGGACTTSVILVSNSSVYCITPEVPWAAVCPSEIGGT